MTAINTISQVHKPAPIQGSATPASPSNPATGIALAALAKPKTFVGPKITKVSVPPCGGDVKKDAREDVKPSTTYQTATMILFNYRADLPKDSWIIGMGQKKMTSRREIEKSIYSTLSTALHEEDPLQYSCHLANTAFQLHQINEVRKAFRLASMITFHDASLKDDVFNMLFDLSSEKQRELLGSKKEYNEEVPYYVAIYKSTPAQTIRDFIEIDLTDAVGRKEKHAKVNPFPKRDLFKALKLTTVVETDATQSNAPSADKKVPAASKTTDPLLEAILKDNLIPQEESIFIYSEVNDHMRKRINAIYELIKSATNEIWHKLQLIKNPTVRSRVVRYFAEDLIYNGELHKSLTVALTVERLQDRSLTLFYIASRIFETCKTDTEDFSKIITASRLGTLIPVLDLRQMFFSSMAKLNLLSKLSFFTVLHLNPHVGAYDAITTRITKFRKGMESDTKKTISIEEKSILNYIKVCIGLKIESSI